MRVQIVPSPCLRPLELLERGNLLDTRAVARVAGLAPAIARKELDVARSVLGWEAEQFEVEILDAACGPGNVLLLTARYETMAEMVVGFGERQVSGASLALNAARRLRGLMEGGATVGPCLADQLLLPMALAGAGSFTTVRPSGHVLTNIGTIAHFLDVSIGIHPQSEGLYRVAVG